LEIRIFDPISPENFKMWPKKQFQAKMLLYLDFYVSDAGGGVILIIVALRSSVCME